ncbi:MAG: hypothetical protein CL883_05420 [Dehalococcoidia bacterium]|nr:hypothetical protein [Dehalococcoidia bacterium]
MKQAVYWPPLQLSGLMAPVYIGSLNKKIYILDGDWNLYLINYQGPGDIINPVYENLHDGTCSKNRQNGAKDTGEEMVVSIAEFDEGGRGSSNFLSQCMIFFPRLY